MTIFDEGNLRFQFGERWQVIKLDDSDVYRMGIEHIDGTKAVDFVGILDEQEIYLIEVKDFRGHRIENKNRVLKGELLIEVAQKVRDSVACIVATSRTHNEPFWNLVNQLFRDARKQLRIVLWFESDQSPHFRQQSRIKAAMRIGTLNENLRWLSCRPIITGIEGRSIPDLTVTNLPHNVE